MDESPIWQPAGAPEPEAAETPKPEAAETAEPESEAAETARPELEAAEAAEPEADDPTASHCPWCSRPFYGDPDMCPHCGATLHPVLDTEALPIPGVTEVPKRLREYLAQWTQSQKKLPLRQQIRALTGPHELETAFDTATEPGALLPPSNAVRLEMLRMALEERQAEVARQRAATPAQNPEQQIASAAPPASQAVEPAAAQEEEPGPVDTAESEGSPTERK
jgi:hypothetical protein